jgi:hypothetical protein
LTHKVQRLRKYLRRYDRGPEQEYMAKLLVTILGYYSALLLLRGEEEPFDVKPSDTILAKFRF